MAEKQTKQKKQTNIIPTKDEFMLEFNILPKGNPANAYENLKFHIASKLTFLGKDVTWDMIKEQWGKYINKCKADNQPEKFIKSMDSFIQACDYNNNFDGAGTATSWLDKWSKK